MDLPQLRTLLRAAIDRNLHTLTEAAQRMHTSQPQLTRFLNGQIDCSAELAIRIAHYTSLPYATVLQLAGQENFLQLLITLTATPAPTLSPAAQRFATLTATATPQRIDLALQVSALILAEK